MKRSFEIRRSFAEAWQRTWENFPLWLGVGFVFVLAMVASIGTFVGVFLALPVLVWGGYAFALAMHDGRASLQNLFSGFSQYGKALGGMLGFFLLGFVIGLPANALTQWGAFLQDYRLVAAGYALTLLLTFSVSTRLTFAPFLMVDRGVGLRAALSESWNRTSALKGRLVLLMLAMMLVSFAGFLVFFVGSIPAMVIGFLAWASAYRQIFGGAPQPAA